LGLGSQEAGHFRKALFIVPFFRAKEISKDACLLIRVVQICTMELWVIVAVALLGAFLSFYSGFGLGTLLLPAFSLLFPLPVAIASTAVVHMLNNVFKLGLVGKYAAQVWDYKCGGSSSGFTGTQIPW
jgi:hypothetical protein